MADFLHVCYATSPVQGAYKPFKASTVKVAKMRNRSQLMTEFKTPTNAVLIILAIPEKKGFPFIFCGNQNWHLKSSFTSIRLLSWIQNGLQIVLSWLDQAASWQIKVHNPFRILTAYQCHWYWSMLVGIWRLKNKVVRVGHCHTREE